MRGAGSPFSGDSEVASIVDSGHTRPYFLNLTPDGNDISSRPIRGDRDPLSSSTTRDNGDEEVGRAEDPLWQRTRELLADLHGCHALLQEREREADSEVPRLRRQVMGLLRMLESAQVEAEEATAQLAERDTAQEAVLQRLEQSEMEHLAHLAQVESLSDRLAAALGPLSRGIFLLDHQRAHSPSYPQSVSSPSNLTTWSSPQAQLTHQIERVEALCSTFDAQVRNITDLELEVQVLRETHDDLRAQVMGATQIREVVESELRNYITLISNHVAAFSPLLASHEVRLHTLCRALGVTVAEAGPSSPSSSPTTALLHHQMSQLLSLRQRVTSWAEPTALALHTLRSTPSLHSPQSLLPPDVSLVQTSSALQYSLSTDGGDGDPNPPSEDDTADAFAAPEPCVDSGDCGDGKADRADAEPSVLQAPQPTVQSPTAQRPAAFLGVELLKSDVESARSPAPGVVVAGVRGPALAAGLTAGDVIVALDDQPITSVVDFAAASRALIPGHAATVRVSRNAETLTLSVVPAPPIATERTASGHSFCSDPPLADRPPAKEDPVPVQVVANGEAVPPAGGAVGYLGIEVAARDKAAEGAGPSGGVRVTKVQGPAQDARLLPGDAIASFNNQPIRSVVDFKAAARLVQPGHVVALKVTRAGRPVLLAIEAVAQEQRPAPSPTPSSKPKRPKSPSATPRPSNPTTPTTPRR